MIQAVIIEDEPLTADYLRTLLQQVDPTIHVAAILHSVADGLLYFSKPHAVDLIFCDVQLGDGHSFTIMAQTEIKMPVVFITAFDSFVMQAFEQNGLDYLLKPVNKEDLVRSIVKYRKFKDHFDAPLWTEKINRFVQTMTRQNRTRILVKKGAENLLLALKDVVFFYTDNKIVFAVDNQGKKYILGKNLSELEEELDPQQFFRANRQCIVNLDYIKSFKAYERVKIWVELSVNPIDYSIVISQENAMLFRKWVASA